MIDIWCDDVHKLKLNIKLFLLSSLLFSIQYPMKIIPEMYRTTRWDFYVFITIIGLIPLLTISARPVINVSMQAWFIYF